MSRDYALYDPADDPLAVPRNNKDVKTILDTVTNESDQIDAICELRGWWHIDQGVRATLDAYLSGSASLSDTVNRLASPIEETYMSADHGRAFWDAELTARAARQTFKSEEVDMAEEVWGQPVAMCEPDPSPEHYDTTEGQLWRLYFSIIHASRKVPWQTKSSQNPSLVDLVRALKQRKDPPQPDNMTPALRNDWIWKSNKVWSNLIMLGPSARESWNDQPGGTMGFTPPEIHAWENENAFVAHLTAEGIMDFMIYGVWAFRDALEGVIASDNRLPMTEEIKAQRIEVTLGVIVVWLHIAGEVIFARISHVDFGTETPSNGGIDASWLQLTEISSRRWDHWKTQLGDLTKSDDLNVVARSHAADALSLMQKLG